MRSFFCFVVIPLSVLFLLALFYGSPLVIVLQFPYGKLLFIYCVRYRLSMGIVFDVLSCCFVGEAYFLDDASQTVVEC